uniref:Uncharacterized protein n=1 Tax=Arundo donax TaxID=35708 RepID=A0A0A9HNL1_ARUDO
MRLVAMGLAASFCRGGSPQIVHAGGASPWNDASKGHRGLGQTSPARADKPRWRRAYTRCACVSFLELRDLQCRSGGSLCS